MTTLPTEQTWTAEQAAALRAYLHRPDYAIPDGLGTREAACSIGAINMALGHHLHDKPPMCMSQVLGYWIRTIQDLMPAQLRNSPAWKQALERSVNTGRDLDLENARIAALVDWLYNTALPCAQPAAAQQGFGTEWRLMCATRCPEPAGAIAAKTLPQMGMLQHAHRVAANVVNINDRSHWCFQGHATAIAKVAGSAAYFAHLGVNGAAHAYDPMQDPVGLLRIWERFDPASTLRRVSQVTQAAAAN